MYKLMFYLTIVNKITSLSLVVGTTVDVPVFASCLGRSIFCSPTAKRKFNSLRASSKLLKQ